MANPKSFRSVLALCMAVFALLLFWNGKKVSDTAGVNRVFTIAELQADFQTLRKKLETQPGLYFYTNKTNFDRLFDSLYLSINRPMDSFEFYDLITNLYPAIKNGHTLFLPPLALMVAHSEKDLFFPFDIFFVDQRMYVLRNCSDDLSIQVGDEILSINGLSVDSIYKNLMRHQLRDGHNSTYPNWILNQWFREYYSYHYNLRDTFLLSYAHETETIVTPVSTLPKSKIRSYRQERYPKVNEPPVLSFSLDTSLHAARLSIRSFDQKELGKQSFKQFVGHAFARMEEAKTQNLILDLRDNQGGNPAYGKLLLSYLLDEPFRLVEKGPASGKTHPQKKIFKGSVYVLVNGGSFSVTAMVASCLSSKNRSVIIGEETGGNGEKIAGSARSVVLPHTKMYCEIPKRVWYIRSYDSSGHGILPDISVKHEPSDYLNAGDACMEMVERLILQQ
jgi:hypothetical protein